MVLEWWKPQTLAERLVRLKPVVISRSNFTSEQISTLRRVPLLVKEPVIRGPICAGWDQKVTGPRPSSLGNCRRISNFSVQAGESNQTFITVVVGVPFFPRRNSFLRKLPTFLSGRMIVQQVDLANRLRTHRLRLGRVRRRRPGRTPAGNQTASRSVD